jgi:hypothetical protein
MTTMDPSSLGDFERALTELADNELARFIEVTFNVAREFADAGMRRPSDLYHRIGVLAAEEADRRKAMEEHTRRELDGDDAGEIIS